MTIIQMHHWGGQISSWEVRLPPLKKKHFSIILCLLCHHNRVRIANFKAQITFFSKGVQLYSTSKQHAYWINTYHRLKLCHMQNLRYQHLEAKGSGTVWWYQTAGGTVEHRSFICRILTSFFQLPYYTSFVIV